MAKSFTFFRSSVSTYRLVEKFCKENPAFTKNLAEVKAAFNPIAAYYKEPIQAWIYANSQAAETRDAVGPDAWDAYGKMLKYANPNPAAEKILNKWFGKKAP